VKRYKLRIDGPEGKIETLLNDPEGDRKGLALIAHPHPLHGGTMDNKVVQTVATTLTDLGYVAVRPNFRGVGMSEGQYDHGDGEVEDMLAIARFVMPRYPGLPLVLVGFSFGAYVQAQVHRVLEAKRLVLIGPAVNMFDFGAVPEDTVVIHGEEDELVPLAAIRAWADPQGLEVAVVPHADHFFHRKLAQLKEVMVRQCRC
jgi:alpha/beta superfamily hydrolase